MEARDRFMINEFSRPISVLLHMLLVVSALLCPRTVAAGGDDIVDRELAARLQELGFTGNIEATLEKTSQPSCESGSRQSGPPPLV